MSTPEPLGPNVMRATSADGVGTDVLIVGGGPVGLAASISLSRLGIGSVLVERHPGTAIHPKALHLSTRTMEVFRAWGVADDIRAAALPTTDHAMFLGHSLADPDFVRHPIWSADDTVSAEHSRLVSQEKLEPILLDHARRGIGQLHFNARLTAIERRDDGVDARIEHVDADAPRLIHARYVIGADGADSTIRHIAGIGFPGTDVHHSINIRFRADLSKTVADRRSAFYYVQNDVVRGLLPVIDNRSDWRLHIVLGPDESAAEQMRPERQLELVRAAVGVPDLDPELLPGFPWTAGARVAQRLRDGALFLAGDAAHVNPPSGGLGMNCGIQDVHNLVWKLAAVIAGRSDEGLLDTYDAERRPVALRTVAEAHRNHEYEAAPVHTEADRRRKHDRRRQLGLVLGHYYDSTAVIPDGTAAPAVADEYSDYAPSARPGHRAPHMWVTSTGRRCSLLDLLATDRPTLITGSPDIWREWTDATGVHLVSIHDTGADVREICSLYAIASDGAVIVRPDGIVSARTPHALTGDNAENFVRSGTFGRTSETVR